MRRFISASILASALTACSWFQAHQTQIDKTVKDEFNCIVTSAVTGTMTVEQIATKCGGVAVVDVIDILVSVQHNGLPLPEHISTRIAAGK